MTKLECIQAYSDGQKIATWNAMGSQCITAASERLYFAENTVYKIEVNCPLQGSLIFCKKELILPANSSGLNWGNFALAGYGPGVEYGSTTFGDNIISPNFVLILSKKYTDNPRTPIPSSFTPFQENIPADGSVIIEEKDYENCIKCLGYPFITEDELEYSRADIIDLAIRPALEEYFHWLPFERIEEYPVTGGIQYITMPSDAYDVLGVSVQQRGTHGSGNITNTLLRYFDEASYGSFNYAGMTGTYRGTMRPHTAVTSPDSYITTRQLAQAQVNLNTRVHFDKVVRTDPSTGEQLKQLRLSSNKLGVFNIHWAIHSLNFNDVKYQQRQNMFKYCQAEVMQLFGNLRRQAKADIAGSVDYDKWIDEAKTMKEEVVNDWKQLVKASSIMRGSL